MVNQSSLPATKRAWSVVANFAKLYLLKIHPRATDHLRCIDAGMNLRMRHVQSVAEHELLTAKLVELVYYAYDSLFASYGQEIDLVWASFMATHHDDCEWMPGDMVPSIHYGCNDVSEKRRKETNALRNLLKPFSDRSDDTVLRCHREYERRNTSEAKLVKLCDMLELFVHNRVLLSFDLGIITPEEIGSYLPEVQYESEEFLRKFHTERLSIAEVLEDIYLDRFSAMAFPAPYITIMGEMLDAIRAFPFRDEMEGFLVYLE